MIDSHVDSCVMCGDTDDAVCCYSCGSLLEVMSSHWYNTNEGHARNTVFHCNTCGCDWEKDEEFVAKPVKFSRKFWG